MSVKKFICMCGKEFKSQKSLSAHQASCKEHYLQRDGNLNNYFNRKNNLQIANKKNAAHQAKKLSENAKLKKEKLMTMWILEQNRCEKCNKVMTEYFGSGRFCSRSCANSHNISNSTKEKISKSYENRKQCQCHYCNKQIKATSALAAHERNCLQNPNRIDKSSSKRNKYKQIKTTNGEYIELDVTIGFIEDYKKIVTCCEICGKSIEEILVKNFHKTLCIDHDHNTGRFRGLLCTSCNRNLGWYETHVDMVTQYLDKTLKLDDDI